MGWRIAKTGSGLNSLENFNISCGDTLRIISLIEQAYCARAEYFPVYEEDVNIEIVIDGERLLCGWESSCGCFVMATAKSGNVIIERIADFLSGYSSGKKAFIHSPEYPPLKISLRNCIIQK